MFVHHFILTITAVCARQPNIVVPAFFHPAVRIKRCVLDCPPRCDRLVLPALLYIIFVLSLYWPYQQAETVAFHQQEGYYTGLVPFPLHFIIFTVHTRDRFRLTNTFLSRAPRFLLLFRFKPRMFIHILTCMYFSASMFFIIRRSFHRHFFLWRHCDMCSVQNCNILTTFVRFDHQSFHHLFEKFWTPIHAIPPILTPSHWT